MGRAVVEKMTGVGRRSFCGRHKVDPGWLQGQESRGQGAAAEEPACLSMQLVRLAGAGHAAGQR